MQNTANYPQNDLGVITTIQELLAGRNEAFDKSDAIKLVRHADTRDKKERLIDGKTFDGTLRDLYRFEPDRFRQYQSEQRKGVFDKTEFIVVFVGEKGTTSRFIAVYKLCGLRQNPKVENEWICDFREVEEFKPLSQRIVIDWGKSTVSWHQNYKEQIKPVIRIDEGFEDANGIPRFISYHDVYLTFPEMKMIIDTEDKDWQNVLKAVNCIYLIQDSLNGKQYVGSTYGTQGIWQRWAEYVRTGGHGGNVKLKERFKDDPDYARHLHWSILEILPIRITEADAIEREDLYKRKFMTRTFGYNQN